MGESLLRLRTVVARVGIGRSKIYELMAEDDFPHPIKEGARSLWVESQIEAWILARIAKHNMGTNMGSNSTENKKAA